jgi:hypothetical protein
MHLSTRYGLAGIGSLSLLAAVHQLRDAVSSPRPTSDYLLGILPNFAAAIAITFVPLSIWSDQNRQADFALAKRPFLVCACISGLGLLAWEIFQKTSTRFVFDMHDLGATAIGVGAATLIFYVLTPRLPHGL